jgi:hypothetical protein
MSAFTARAILATTRLARRRARPILLGGIVALLVPGPLAAQGLDPTSKATAGDSDGIVTFPDVSRTPSPSGPVPMPYPPAAGGGGSAGGQQPPAKLTPISGLPPAIGPASSAPGATGGILTKGKGELTGTGRPGKVLSKGKSVAPGIQNASKATTSPSEHGMKTAIGKAPPVAAVPVKVPPVTAPPVSTPPVTTLPVKMPPVSAPPVTAPPVKTPIVSAPPVLAPPVKTPPVSAPPVTAPPVKISAPSMPTVQKAEVLTK